MRIAFPSGLSCDCTSDLSGAPESACFGSAPLASRAVAGRAERLVSEGASRTGGPALLPSRRGQRGGPEQEVLRRASGRVRRLVGPLGLVFIGAVLLLGSRPMDRSGPDIGRIPVAVAAVVLCAVFATLMSRPSLSRRLRVDLALVLQVLIVFALGWLEAPRYVGTDVELFGVSVLCVWTLFLPCGHRCPPAPIGGGDGIHRVGRPRDGGPAGRPRASHRCGGRRGVYGPRTALRRRRIRSARGGRGPESTPRRR